MLVGTNMQFLTKSSFVLFRGGSGISLILRIVSYGYYFINSVSIFMKKNIVHVYTVEAEIFVEI